MDRPDTHDPAHHLSTPWLRWLQANTPMRALDAVVIGSGYGGAVAALRLAQKGWRVTVLERGSEYRPGEFPNDLAMLPKHVRAPSPDGRAVAGRATGLFEWRAGPGALALVANGVGGGSLINAGAGYYDAGLQFTATTAGSYRLVLTGKSTGAASAFTNQAAVEPVPSPTTMPG